MARVHGVTRDQIDPTERDWLAAKVADGVPGLAHIDARQPAMARARDALGSAINESGTLPPRLLELVRLRIAFHNQCRTCMAVRYQSGLDAGVGEDLVCSLERPEEAHDLSDAERSALRFADLFATDHRAIDDVVYDDLRRHFSEAELVELGFKCALCVGFGRLAATWDVTEDLPERFRDQDGAELCTPWGEGGVLVMGSARR